MPVEIEITSPWLNGDINADQVLRENFHNEAFELFKAEKMLIQGRTMVKKGGLVSDIMTEVNPNPNDSLLGKIYSGTENQIAAWNRVYVEYQEGGALGLETYTNPPRLMYTKVTTSDMPIIQAWADQTVEKIIAILTGG